MDKENISAWLNMRDDQIAHGRHHELLRSQSTNMIIAISAAILAFTASSELSHTNQWALVMLLIIINGYGFLMSLKHHERSRLHYSVGRKYADVISDVTRIEEQSLNDIRESAHKEHRKPCSMVHHLRASVLWAGLHLLIASIGLVLVISA